MTRSEAGKLGAKALKENGTAQKRAFKIRQKYLENPKLCLYCQSIIIYNLGINAFKLLNNDKL